MMVLSPMAGVVAQVLVQSGQAVKAGELLLVIEAMKMEHEICATTSGVIEAIRVKVGQMVDETAALLAMREISSTQAILVEPSLSEFSLNQKTPLNTAAGIRADLQAVIDREFFNLDSTRPQAIAKRQALGFRSARQNIDDLCDVDSFIEYGAFAYAAQTQRRSEQELIEQTPADGIVTGLGKVAGIQCAILAYDMTVLAGTQGMRNHQKTDRLLGIALERRLPVILFAEGGGGRPGDTDMPIIAGLHISTFAMFGKLSGLVPMIGIVNGRCFAGNAAVLGTCDVIIATKTSNIGMGGPAMIEGGGLGVFAPDAVGPSDVQSNNGVIDVLVEDEAAAVAEAKKYLAHVMRDEHTARSALAALDPRGSVPVTTASSQLQLRELIPENRLRSYNIRGVIAVLFDADSFLELQKDYGKAVLMGFVAIGGKSVFLMANNSKVLGGAIDANAADKLAQGLKLAQQYQLPIVSLVDTPGFMVGPDEETKAQVRWASQLFVESAKLTVPKVAIVLRKGYGLGAMAMTAGGFHQTMATMAWPTAEFGAMGLEGAVRLGYRKELEAEHDLSKREALYSQLLEKQYAQGKAIRMAETLEIDAVIDPAKTRQILIELLLNNT